MTAPAGATVVATMQNDDADVEHNLTFSVPGLPHGDTCKGPCTATQTFLAPAAGSYFFLCTLLDMVGYFIRATLNRRVVEADERIWPLRAPVV